MNGAPRRRLKCHLGISGVPARRAGVLYTDTESRSCAGRQQATLLDQQGRDYAAGGRGMTLMRCLVKGKKAQFGHVGIQDR